MAQAVNKIVVKNQSDQAIGAVVRIPEDHGDYANTFAPGGELEFSDLTLSGGSDVWVTVAPSTTAAERSYFDGPHVIFNGEMEGTAVYTVTGPADNLTVTVDYQN